MKTFLCVPTTIIDILRNYCIKEIAVFCTRVVINANHVPQLVIVKKNKCSVREA